MMIYLKPIYDKLLKNENLIYVTNGMTTNCVEPINSQIWNRASKNVFLGRDSLLISVNDVVICKNHSYLKREQIFKRLWLEEAFFKKIIILNYAWQI